MLSLACSHSLESSEGLVLPRFIMHPQNQITVLMFRPTACRGRRILPQVGRCGIVSCRASDRGSDVLGERGCILRDNGPW